MAFSVTSLLKCSEQKSNFNDIEKGEGMSRQYIFFFNFEQIILSRQLTCVFVFSEVQADQNLNSQHM